MIKNEFSDPEKIYELGDFTPFRAVKHPHNGYILCFGLDQEGKKRLNFVQYSDQKEVTELGKFETGEIKHEFSYTTFLNLKGWLMLLYAIDGTIYKTSSHDYGKTWQRADRIYEGADGWILFNRPLYVQSGRILVPAHNKRLGRCFVLVSDDGLNTIHPSTFIELPEIPRDSLLTAEEDEFDDPFVYKTRYPILIHQSENIVMILMQTENLKHIYQADSPDLGETWTEAAATSIFDGNDIIDASRRFTTDGVYLPDIAVVYTGRFKDAYKLRIIASEDNGKTYSHSFDLDSKEQAEILCPRIVVDAAGKMDILYYAEGSVFLIQEIDQA